MSKLTHEQFDKMWEDSTKEEVLFQFYYDYYEKVEALDIIDKAIEYIEENCMFHNENNEECYFNYGDALSPKKLVDILKGSEE